MNYIVNLIKKYKEYFIIGLLILVVLFALYISIININNTKNKNLQLKGKYYVEVDGISYTFKDFQSIMSNISSGNDDFFNPCDVKSIYVHGHNNSMDMSFLELFENLEIFKAKDVNIENILLKSESLQKVNLNNVTINGKIMINTSSISELNMDNMLINDKLIDIFSKSKELKILSVRESECESIESLLAFKYIESIDVRTANVIAQDYYNLKKFSKLNGIYVNKGFNRDNIDFILDNFKEGDMHTVAYVVSIRHNLRLRRGE